MNEKLVAKLGAASCQAFPECILIEEVIRIMFPKKVVIQHQDQIACIGV